MPMEKAPRLKFPRVKFVARLIPLARTRWHRLTSVTGCDSHRARMKRKSSLKIYDFSRGFN